MSSAYTCPLDAATQQKALEELYEDPKNRQGAIDTFRDWILQQKHIKCPTDDIFLLGFLRARHFSQLEARQALERFMELRDKLSDWMKNLDPTANDINGMIDHGMLRILPDNDHNGQKVAIIKPSLMDGGNKKMMLANCRLFACMGYYNYLTDEATQVHGTVSVADWTGQTMAKEMKMPLDTKKNISTMLSKGFPSRVKAIHMYNPGALIEFLMTMFRSLLTEKLRKRLHVHNNLESLYKDIPMEILPDEYLPDDYTGSSAGSIKQVTASLKAVLQSPEIVARIKYLSSEEFYIKMSERDTDTPATSFRKLTVD